MPHHTGAVPTIMTIHILPVHMLPVLIDLAMLIPSTIHITLHRTLTEAHIIPHHIPQDMLAHITPDIEVTLLTQPGLTPPDMLLHPQLSPTLPHTRPRSLLNPQVREKSPPMTTPQLALLTLMLPQLDPSHMLIMTTLIQDILHHTTHHTDQHMSPHTPVTSLLTD